jgi:hypothetical protein
MIVAGRFALTPTPVEPQLIQIRPPTLNRSGGLCIARAVLVSRHASTNEAFQNPAEIGGVLLYAAQKKGVCP